MYTLNEKEPQFEELNSECKRLLRELLEQLEATQHELENQGGWALEQRVETVISRLSLAPDARFDSLSGGVQRRVLLARALVSSPDLLLLALEHFRLAPSETVFLGDGRYDRLAETLGGKAMPAVGFGFGDAVITELLKDKDKLPELPRQVDDVVFAFGETERPEAMASSTLPSTETTGNSVAMRPPAVSSS